MKWFAICLSAVWPLAAQTTFERFSRDLPSPDLRVAIVQGGRVAWHRGNIAEAACEEPVIAERIPRQLLDTPAPVPAGATIRQVLDNRADGTPGEEVLENRDFFEALHTTGSLPNAITFAKVEHGTLGWLSQQYGGERVLWCHSPSVFIVRVPGKRLSLVAATDFAEPNVARSLIALAFFKDVAGLRGTERDEMIDRSLIAFYNGDREGSAALVHKAVDRFPELETTPDVTLLHLFAQLGLPETESSATAVIRDHPSLPTAWFYYGQYLENSKRYREAAACYEKITMHEPPWHNWTVEAAKKELKFLKTY